MTPSHGGNTEYFNDVYDARLPEIVSAGLRQIGRIDETIEIGFGEL